MRVAAILSILSSWASAELNRAGASEFLGASSERSGAAIAVSFLSWPSGKRRRRENVSFRSGSHPRKMTLGYIGAG